MNGKKLKQIIKYLFIILLFIIFTIGGTVSGVAYTYIEEAPPLDINKFEYIQPSIILDKDGVFYAELQGKEKREVVSIDRIPENVSNAFIAIEDERFRDHFGIDIQGISRAAMQGIKEGDITSAGGSTITQQLIKLTHLTPNKVFSRKIKEAYLSIQLEKAMDKDKILENYLNKINFAYAHGIQAASKVYFKKDVEELTLAQAAVLAAIPKAPTTYKPYIIEQKEDESFGIALDENEKIVHSTNNQQRALAVINKMKELSFITDKEHQEAKDQLLQNDFGLILPPEETLYSYFTDAVYNQVLSELMEKYYSDFPLEEAREKASDFMLNSGLTIHSTMDVNIQSKMDDNFNDDSLFPKQSSIAKKASEEKSKEDEDKISYKPEGAMVVLENSTGEVRGIVGGRDKKGNLSLNRAFKGFQPGSSTKPLTVYAPGIESKKLTLATTYDDVPIKIKVGQDDWSPGNSPNTFAGLTTLRNGLYKSKNVVAVQAWYDTGLETSVKYGEKFGLSIVKEGRINDMGPAALSLGGYTYGQTPLAMASAYSTFPNKGVRQLPTFFTRVEDATGKTILEHKIKKVEVISPETAFIVNDVLMDVPRGGTTNLSIPDMEIAGKTGTTDEQMHAWYVGYTPYYTAAVWYGYDENVVKINANTENEKIYHLNINLYGGSKPGPALMWENVMRDIHKDLKPMNLPSKPDGIVEAKVDAVSGKLPTSLSYRDPRGSQVITEFFLPGTVPVQKDDYHISIGGRVYIQKPNDRFPSPIEAINSNYHPENQRYSIVISPSRKKQITSILAANLKQQQEESQKKEEAIANKKLEPKPEPAPNPETEPVPVPKPEAVPEPSTEAETKTEPEE